MFVQLFRVDSVLIPVREEPINRTLQLNTKQTGVASILSALNRGGKRFTWPGKPLAFLSISKTRRFALWINLCAQCDLLRMGNLRFSD